MLENEDRNVCMYDLWILANTYSLKMLDQNQTEKKEREGWKGKREKKLCD